MRKANILIGILAIASLIPSVHAAELGINYYHETMMSSQWGTNYIERTPTEVASDMQTIAQLTDYVKLYANPFAAGNIDHVRTVIDTAKAQGLHTAVSLNVDDRQLTDENWDEYRGLVLSACDTLTGEADSIQVANEVLLHTKWDAAGVRERVEPLIRDCEQRFEGEVTYQGFWYEKDAWKDYTGPIFFNLYEPIESFKVNLAEFEASFGSNGRIGEWGTSRFENGDPRTEEWKSQNIVERWDLIKDVSAPVAYIFTYTEPSQDGFGISDRLDVIASLADSTYVAPEPVEEPEQPAVGGELRCSSSAGCTFDGRYDNGCPEYRFNVGTSDTVGVKLCPKDGAVEMYRTQNAALYFSVCFEGACIDQTRGFDRLEGSYSIDNLEPIGETATQREPEQTTEPVEDNTTDERVSDGSSVSIADLQLRVETDAQILVQNDTMSGSCRAVTVETDRGTYAGRACPKGDGFEVYRDSNIDADIEVCFEQTCIDELRGFASGTFEDASTDDGTSDPIVDDSNVSQDEQPQQEEQVTREGATPSIRPEGSLESSDIGGCSTYRFTTPDGDVKVGTCEKGDAMEAYYQGGPEGYDVCFGSECVSKNAGFKRWALS